MSEKSGGFFRSRWTPVLVLFFGLILLWLGNQEYQQFQTEIGDYVIARPNDHTMWLFILGAAASVAGILGLVRGRAF